LGNKEAPHARTSPKPSGALTGSGPGVVIARGSAAGFPQKISVDRHLLWADATAGASRAAERFRILPSHPIMGDCFGTKTSLTHESGRQSAAGIRPRKQALALGFARVPVISTEAPSDRLQPRIYHGGHFGPLPRKAWSEVCCGFWSHLPENRSARSRPLHLTRRCHTDRGCPAPLALGN
jgi:hypothetical protein